jgi:hypothetical protein
MDRAKVKTAVAEAKRFIERGDDLRGEAQLAERDRTEDDAG